jgi:hypothetical protein
MSFIPTLTQILGLSVVAGVNLYAAILVVGLGIRFEWIRGVPSELHILAHPAVLILAGALYLVEFLADKIPFVTPVWDAIHTLIRPLGAAGLAWGASAGADPLFQTMAGLAGGAIGLGTHSTKMGLRLMAHASPEPVSHSVISVAEDLGVVGLLILAYQYPWAAFFVVLGLLVLMAFLLPMVLRIIRFLLTGVADRLHSWFTGDPSAIPVETPRWLRDELQKKNRAEFSVYPAFARSVNGSARLRRGYLLCTQHDLAFLVKKLTGMRGSAAPQGAATRGSLERGVLFDVFSFEDENQRVRSVYLTKLWSKKLQREQPQRITSPAASPRHPVEV